MAVDFAHFMFNLILAGFLLRYVQMKLTARNADDPLAKAIAFVY